MPNGVEAVLNQEEVENYPVIRGVKGWTADPGSVSRLAGGPMNKLTAQLGAKPQLAGHSYHCKVGLDSILGE